MNFFPQVQKTAALGAAMGLICLSASAQAQETLPWQQRSADQTSYYRDGSEPRYAAPRGGQQVRPYEQARQRAPGSATPPNPYGAKPRVDRYDYGQARNQYQPPAAVRAQQRSAPAYPQSATRTYQPPARQIRPYRPPQERQYGANAPYQPSYGQPNYGNQRYDDRRYDRRQPRVRMPKTGHGTYSENEVVDAGHRFFGSLSSGLAKAIQWAFKNSGRPNGYILGEDAGGAFVAGLRYGEGKLFTKNYGVHRIYWQGPSIGYDFGGDGNRTMTLVYNLRSPRDVYRRFGGVQGSAYLVGGVSVQLLKAKDVTLAPIRTGVGLRLGANIGYLKYTRRPTWNPF